MEWVKPFFILLEHGVGDWGLAVILFTVLVRLCLIPFSRRQSDFAVKQYLFSQQMAELKERMQGNQEKMAEEMAKMMQEKGFNPLGMLTTVVIQAPIFMTVYALFRHLGPTAHSVLVPWVSSIGLPDPLMILPIVVAILSGLLSKITLIPGDLTTSSSPSHFSFYLITGVSLLILWSAPVAISLYYCTSSLWGAFERILWRKRVRKQIEQEGLQTSVSV